MRSQKNLQRFCNKTTENILKMRQITVSRAGRKRKKKNPQSLAALRIFLGDPAGIRTPDPLLKRQLLCRLSYRVTFLRMNLTRRESILLSVLRKREQTNALPPLGPQTREAFVGRKRRNFPSGGVFRRSTAGSAAVRGISELAGTAGLEPAHEGVKVPCLTAWLRPRVQKGAQKPLGKSAGTGEKPRSPACVGWEMGLEPTTPGTTIRCSNQLSYTHHISTV